MALNMELATRTHEYILVCAHVDTYGGQTLMSCFFFPSAMRQGLTVNLELPYWLDWQAGNSPDPLVCLPITEVTETRCQPRHTGAVELNLGPTLVQKTVSALSHPPAPRFTFEEIADAKPNVSKY